MPLPLLLQRRRVDRLEGKLVEERKEKEELIRRINALRVGGRPVFSSWGFWLSQYANSPICCFSHVQVLFDQRAVLWPAPAAGR